MGEEELVQQMQLLSELFEFWSGLKLVRLKAARMSSKPQTDQ